MGCKLNSMNLESPKIIVKKSSEEIYGFLIEIKNFEKLMPEGISKFNIISKSEFLFALKGIFDPARLPLPQPGPTQRSIQASTY